VGDNSLCDNSLCKEEAKLNASSTNPSVLTLDNMADFFGHATMNMRLPMTSTVIPVRGDCEVHGEKLKIMVLSNTLTLGMPSKPSEDDMTYNINFEGEGKFTIKVKYISSLQCYKGSATLDGKDEPSVTFTFASKDSPLAALRD